MNAPLQATIRITAVAAGSWLLLTVVAVLLHRFAWGAQPHDGLLDVWLLRASNIANLSMLPGWIFDALLFGGSGVASPIGVVVGCAIGSAVWIAGGVGLWLTRARMLNPARSRRVAPAMDPARRRFLIDGAGAAAGLVTIGAGARASLVDPWDLHLRRDTIPIEGLPEELEGLRIIHICDTHLGPRVPASFIRRAVQMAADLRPDIAALVGDYVHDDIACIDDAARLFDPLIGAARIGTIGVLGNHDWYADGVAMRRALSERGVTMLSNQRIFIDSRRRVTDSGAVALCVAGFADLTEERIDPAAALRDVPAEAPRIVLAHNPDTAEDPLVAGERGPRIDLMLSGHTHGGQVRLPFLGAPIVPSRYGQKYAEGLVRGPRCPVLVSRGVGMSILPVRFGVPPEVGEITLVRA